MKFTRLILGIVFVTILGLTISQVVVANSISTTGIELARLQTDIKKYKKQNAILKEKVLYAGSLTKIASEAGQLGFVRTTKTVNISAPLPLAKR